MSTEEIYRGFDHGDATEAWRVDAVHRVETGTVPNLLPPELTPDESDYIDRKSRTDTVKMLVATVILLVIANVLAAATLGLGHH